MASRLAGRHPSIRRRGSLRTRGLVGADDHSYGSSRFENDRPGRPDPAATSAHTPSPTDRLTGHSSSTRRWVRRVSQPNVQRTSFERGAGLLRVDHESTLGLLTAHLFAPVGVRASSTSGRCTASASGVRFGGVRSGPRTVARENALRTDCSRPASRSSSPPSWVADLNLGKPGRSAGRATDLSGNRGRCAELVSNGPTAPCLGTRPRSGA
jgi:hypothetical protein